MKKSKIYLDYAAATPIDDEVLAAMRPYFSQKFHNPSATYLAGRQARQDLNQARTVIARLVGAQPGEVVFTAGATEANNLAIQGVMAQYPNGELVVSAIEHDSVLVPAEKHNAKLIPVNEQGLVDIGALEKMATPRTVLISIGLVNNEIGTVQPVSQIAAWVKEVRRRRLAKGDKTPFYLHTDAAQAGNYFDLNTARLGVDLMSLNGGKIYGPKQSGALYIKAGVRLSPLILGGGQEMGLRSGTENLPAAIGLSKAMTVAQNSFKAEKEKTFNLRRFFVSQLEKEIPAIKINGSSKRTAPHIVSATIPGFDNERLMMELDERGIECAIGSACSAADGKPSHVLLAIGLPGTLARSTLRFSFGRGTKQTELAETVQVLARLTRVSR